MVKITQKNDFKLIVSVTAKSGDETLPVDMRTISDVAVNIQSAQQGSYTWLVDADGKLVIDIDGRQFRTGVYPLIVTGLINERDWCFAVKEAFQIVRWTADSNVYVEDNIEVVIPMPPVGKGDDILLATVMDIETYDTLPEKDENTLYIITQE